METLLCEYVSLHNVSLMIVVGTHWLPVMCYSHLSSIQSSIACLSDLGSLTPGVQLLLSSCHSLLYSQGIRWDGKVMVFLWSSEHIAGVLQVFCRFSAVLRMFCKLFLMLSLIELCYTCTCTLSVPNLLIMSHLNFKSGHITAGSSSFYKGNA